MRTLAVFFSLFVVAIVEAQETRFELGQRLRLLEQALDQHTDESARKRALVPLEQATPTFFKGQLAAAAGLLDRARLLLKSDKPASELVWAESLIVQPRKRFLDTKADELPLKIESFYKVEAEQPKNVRIHFTLWNEDQDLCALENVELESLPRSFEWKIKARKQFQKLREGDYLLRSEVVRGGRTLARSEQTVSFADQLSQRIGKLKQTVAKTKTIPATTESATLARMVEILDPLAQGRTLETNYPAARLLREAEDIDAERSADRPYFTKDRSGQHWLSLVTGNTIDPVRVQIPKEAKAGKPLPVVVALHGAGGSENMFFDGYGDGLVARLCAKRGWLLVTTRSPLFSFAGGPNVPRVLDALAKLYPLDKKRIFLVGHSMGAAQAVAAAGRNPERFAGVAALGGGGGFKSSDQLQLLPFFVGCGARDFALNGARSLHRSLVKAGIKQVIFKAYPNVEHLIVVQMALPEVFRFFDEAGRP